MWILWMSYRMFGILRSAETLIACVHRNCTFIRHDMTHPGLSGQQLGQ